MKKIAFLFGAGAEGEKNFNIRTGYEFLKSSLFAEDSMKQALSLYFKDKKFFDENYKYRKETLDITKAILKNLLFQKSVENDEFFNKYNNVILSVFLNDELKVLYNEKNITENIPEHTKMENSKNIIEKIGKILSGERKKYSEIEEDILKEIFSSKDDKIVYDSNIAIGGVLDKYFHTIIAPHKYSKIRFSKIINFYWNCYFIILEDVLKFLTENGCSDFKKYITLDESTKKIKEFKFLDILKDIKLITEQLYSNDYEKYIPEESYYNLIRKKLEENKDNIKCSGVITTNYYKFCEAVSKNTIYLNGQLKYFEYPELLEVSDLSDNDVKNEYLMFPFIFAQSLVKPVVNSVQIEEFHRLKELLDGSKCAETSDCINGVDILVILGYNINEDDNHINSYLHDYVKNNPIIIVTDKDDYNAEKRLKHKNGNIHICRVKYDSNENVVNKIFETIEEIRTKGEKLK